MHRTLGTLAAAAMLLTACGGGDSGSSAPTTDGPNPSSAATTEAPPPDTTSPPSTEQPAPRVLADPTLDQVEALLAASLTDIPWTCCGAPGAATGASVAIRVPGRDDALVATGTTIEGLPFDPQAPFSAAGIAVGLVHSAAYRLIDAGVLDPDATIDTWVPQMPDAATTSLQMLLDNATGWGDPDTAIEANVLPDLGRMWTLGEVVDVFATLTPTDGVGFEIETTVLGYIVEQVTGAPLSEVVREQVTDPLGLDDTSIDHRAPLPTGYQHGVFVLGGMTLDTASVDTTAFYSFLGAVASARSTLPDLLDLLDAWVSGDLLGVERAASERPFPTSEPSANGAGAVFQPGLPVLSYRITRADGTDVAAIGRRPNNVGTTTFLWYFPETGISIAMNHNSQEWVQRDPLSALVVDIHDLVAAELAAG
jgi:CubicO group peptidase (beta-lactamase class C family)